MFVARWRGGSDRGFGVDAASALAVVCVVGDDAIFMDDAAFKVSQDFEEIQAYGQPVQIPDTVRWTRQRVPLASCVVRSSKERVFPWAEGVWCMSPIPARR